MGLFTPEERWWGGCYELAVAVASRELLAEAAVRVWAFPRVAGPFERSDVEPDAQELVATDVEFAEDDELAPDYAPFGIATLDDGRRMPCELFVSTLGHCVLAIGLPQGALDEDYGPGDLDGDPPWLPLATEWLEEVRAWLGSALPIRVAAVGEEVSMILDDLGHADA